MMFRRAYCWFEAHLHSYLTSALLGLGLLYAAVATLPARIDF